MYHVDVYLNDEIKHGAMWKPFKEPPINDLHVGPFVWINPVLINPVIINLHWPKGQSVNSGVDSDKYLNVDFVLTYPSIDKLNDEVLKFGKVCEIFKVDISTAFHHAPIEPGDLDILSLTWNNYYINFLLLFLCKHRSANFQCISDSVRFF